MTGLYGVQWIMEAILACFKESQVSYGYYNNWYMPVLAEWNV